MPHYKKFVIFGQPRSGSTLLVNLLNSQPDIHCDGELLQYQWKYIANKSMCDLVQYYPLPFFSWRQRMHKSQIYGFKLHIYQIKFPHFILSRLAKDDWKIIHLKRRNHIRRALSDLIAKETKHWHSRMNRPDPTYRIHLPVEKIVKAIETKRKWDILEADVLKRLPHFDIDYETDLADASLHQQTIGRFCDYLGLEASPVQTILRKTDPRPFSEILLNYDEIIGFIKNSEFHAFLQQEQIECRQ